MTEIPARVGLAVVLLLCASAAQASVEISSAPTSNMNCSAGVCTPTAKSAVLNVDDLTAMLSSADITVKSGNSAVTIGIVSPFAWASTHRLTLDANLNVNIKAQMMVEGTAGLTIVTNDGGSGGDLMFYPSGKIDFWDTTSSLIINGNSYVLVSDLEGLAKDIHANLQGSYALASDNDLHQKKFHKSPIHQFFGKFEGLGNSIINLDIEGTQNRCVGMFAETGKNSERDGMIRDINLKNVKMVVQVRKNGGAIGALVGCNYASIVNASVDGSVTAGYSGVVGGLVGQNGNGVVRSRSAVTIAEGGLSGGLAGFNLGSIDQSYASGTITSASGGGFVGNLPGNVFPITNCYATGAVNLSGWGGGFAGAAVEKISTSYSVGVVSGSDTIGGFIGFDHSSGDGIEDAYWDLDTSGMSDPSQGAGNLPNDPGITGLTDAQLKSGLPVGFDPKIWAQSAGINNGYPYLIANPPQ